MSEWIFLDAASRDNVMRVWQQESETLFDLLEDPAVWERPTAAGHWQVRDVVAHLIDTTEAYFRSFDAARGEGEPFEPIGLPDMARYADEGAQALREVEQKVLVDRLREARDKMMEIASGLTDEEWSGDLQPVHKYMGALPACFYPIFQVVDYAVHSWDVRCGAGGGHTLEGDAADLLVPLSFILWQYTTQTPPDAPSFELGIRITSGRNAGDYRIALGPEALSWEPGDVGGVPVVIEFDPASFVLTAFGRFNGGTARGDRDLAEQFLSGFFRI